MNQVIFMHYRDSLYNLHHNLWDLVIVIMGHLLCLRNCPKFLDQMANGSIRNELHFNNAELLCLVQLIKLHYVRVAFTRAIL